MNAPEFPLAMLFHMLRARGFALGLGDWLDLHRGVGGGFGVGTVEQLRLCARALWTTSPQEQKLFDQLFDEAMTSVSADIQAESITPYVDTQPSGDFVPTDDETWAPIPTPKAFPSIVESALPPAFEKASEPVMQQFNQVMSGLGTMWLGRSAEFGSQHIGWPLDLRELITTLRNELARQLIDRDRIDITRTVDRIAREGCLLEPVFKQAKQRIKLQFLVDESASMAPYEPLATVLFDALDLAGVAPYCRVAKFRNHPEPRLLAAGENSPIDSGQLLDAVMRAGRSLIVISDAGAARRNDTRARRQAIARWSREMQLRGLSHVWLNPCPRENWANTSAEELGANGVVMEELTNNGVRRALQHLRGKMLVSPPVRPKGISAALDGPRRRPDMEPIERWLSYHERAYTALSMHLAVPLSLTPRLATAIWAEFQYDESGEPINAPWSVVPDFLLSTACREVGPGRFQLADGARTWLLDQFTRETLALGPDRRSQVAQFLWQYVEKELVNPLESVKRMARAQQWAAESLLDPAFARRRFAEELQSSQILDASQFAWLSRIILATQTGRDEDARKLAQFVRELRSRRVGSPDKAQNESRNDSFEIEGIRLPNPTSVSAIEDVSIVLAVKDRGVLEALQRELHQQSGLQLEIPNVDFSLYTGTLNGRRVRLFLLHSSGFEIETYSNWRNQLANEPIQLVIALDYSVSEVTNVGIDWATRTAQSESDLSMITLCQIIRIPEYNHGGGSEYEQTPITSSWRVQYWAREFLLKHMDLSLVAARFGNDQILTVRGQEPLPRAEFTWGDHCGICDLGRYYLPIRWEVPISTQLRQSQAAEMALKLVEFLVNGLTEWWRPREVSKVAYYLPARSSAGESRPTALIDHFEKRKEPVWIQDSSARRNGMDALQYAHDPGLSVKSRVWLRWGNADQRAYDIAAILEEVGSRPRRHAEKDFNGQLDWMSFIEWFRAGDAKLVVVDDVQEFHDRRLQQLANYALKDGKIQLIILSRIDLDLDGVRRLKDPVDTVPPLYPPSVKSRKPGPAGPLLTSYAREIGRELNYFVAWPPNQRIRVGDVGVFHRGLFFQLKSLDDFQFKYMASEKSRLVDLRLETKSTSVKSGIDSIEIKFEGQGQFLIWAHGLLSTALQSMPDLEQELVSAYLKGNWNREWVVVTDVVSCEELTVFMSNSSSGEVKLSRTPLTPALNNIRPDLPSEQRNLRMQSVRDLAFSNFALQGCTPFFRIARVKVPLLRLFGPPRLELMTPRNSKQLSHSTGYMLNEYTDPATTEAHDFALVVGIGDYDYLHSLSSTLNEARQIAAWLGSSDGGRVPTEHLVTLTGRVTTDEFRNAVNGLLNAMAAGPRVRRFYFFFSGHSARILDGEFLLFSESDKGRGVLPSSDLQSLLAVLQRANIEEGVVILNCGYAGASSQQFRVRPPSTPGGVSPPGQWWILHHASSGGYGETGRFTNALLEGLKGGAKDSVGGVTTFSLMNYLQRVWNTRSPNEQFPSFIKSSGRSDPIVLVPRREPHLQ